MNFLAIDTSGRRLVVIAASGERVQIEEIEDCAHAHSERLMGEIERALCNLGLTAADCDFFAVVVGAGSFTGIRIGIATAKGLCLACGKPALAVTSFDTLAYAEGSGKRLALVDAGHGACYACGYEGDAVTVPAAYRTREEVLSLAEEGYALVAGEEIGLPVRRVSPAKGLLAAVRAKCGALIPPHKLEALYLRRSSAEEGRK